SSSRSDCLPYSVLSESKFIEFWHSVAVWQPQILLDQLQRFIYTFPWTSSFASLSALYRDDRLTVDHGLQGRNHSSSSSSSSSSRSSIHKKIFPHRDVGPKNTAGESIREMALLFSSIMNHLFSEPSIEFSHILSCI